MTTTARSFRLVEDVFARGLAKQRVGGAAFAATVDGREVLSLFGGQARPGVPWQVGTPAAVMSVSKGFAALCVQVLVDRGVLDVDALVTDYWPEYGANGKERTTVRHVLTHRAGVVGLPDSPGLLSWDGRGWEDLDAIAARLASAVPAWNPGEGHGYHAVTFGWLLGEIVRRVTGRTLGQFFHDEIAEPLRIRAAIGIDAGRAAEVAVVHAAGMFRVPLLARPLVGKLNATMRDPETLLGQAFLADGKRSVIDAVDELLAQPRFFRAEIPSSNGISCASDLARLYSVLACDGEIEGTRLLSADAVKAFSQHELTADDDVFGRSLTFFGAGLLTSQLRVTRTLGYVLNQPAKGKRRYGPDPMAYGSEGAGGQLAFCDPGRRVSVGFVRSALSPSPQFALDLVDAFYRCLEDGA